MSRAACPMAFLLALVVRVRSGDQLFKIVMAGGDHQIPAAYGMEGWELASNISFDKDNRSDVSTHAAFMAPSPGQRNNNLFKIVNKKGDLYKIVMAGGDYQIPAAYGMEGWELTSHRAFDKDNRSGDSSYAAFMAPDPGQRNNNLFKIVKKGDLYKIVLAGGDHQIHVAYGMEGWELASNRAFVKDNRSLDSSYAAFMAPDPGQRNNNLFKILPVFRLPKAAAFEPVEPSPAMMKYSIDPAVVLGVFIAAVLAFFCFGTCVYRLKRSMSSPEQKYIFAC